MATYTTTDLTNIRRLIAAGAGKVTIAGKTVEYRSLNDLKEIESKIIADLETEEGKKPIRTYRFYSNKGL